MEVSKQRGSSPGVPAKTAPAHPDAGTTDRGPDLPAWTRLETLTAWMGFILVFVVYGWTLAPQVTLQDSGELAVASHYAGVPHPPGYPVWTLYTWLFVHLVPISNVAWRVALSSAVAGAAACALWGALICRLASVAWDGWRKTATAGDERGEGRSWVPVGAGLMSAGLLGFNGFFWSQAVIVEVYTLSVLSLVGVFWLMLAWAFRPSLDWRLRWAFFVFGICFTNHQTLVVAAMGLEVAICMVRPALGRDLFLGNSVVYVAGLFLKGAGWLESLDQNVGLLRIYHLVGLGSVVAAAVLWRRTGRVLTEWRLVLGLGGMWVAGAAFYLLLPVLSSTTPPMNWGYARTWEGFLHAVTRGQYSKATPTSSLSQFVLQMGMFLQGLLDEFSAVLVPLLVLPFLVWKWWPAVVRGWLVGQVAVFLCLGPLLLALLSPASGRQSLDLNKVFFTASHVTVAGLIGLGVAGLFYGLGRDYARWRPRALYVCAALAGVAVYEQMALPSGEPVARAATVVVVGLTAGLILLFALWRTTFWRVGLGCLLGLVPLGSMLAHWAPNEQRGHFFGYWFGHDMFSPPFGVYPEMARGAVLFGGTDPGRFNPTYMIFSESPLAAGKKPLDPGFDRRDVYLITQNALADGTYLNYVRAHYQRSAQVDAPFFQEMVRTSRDRSLGLTSWLSRAVSPLDAGLSAWGGWVEAGRRARGVYPAEEIRVPSELERRELVNQYVTDVTERARRNQLRPGEDPVNFNGQVSVMAINALIAKAIFDANPGREFYVEESFPLEWMYPHLMPFGIIMKLNREPLEDLPAELLDRDRAFWRKYSARLIGDWVSEGTGVEEICEFAQRAYLDWDLKGFAGDRRYLRDINAQKAFSALRSAQAGMFYWRSLGLPPGEAKDRMRRSAEFAYKQAVAFCPFNSQAVYRFCEFLAGAGRLKEALLLARTSLLFDPEEPVFLSLFQQLEQMEKNAGGLTGGRKSRAELEQAFAGEPTNARVGLELAGEWIAASETNRALEVLGAVFKSGTTDASLLAGVAQGYARLGRSEEVEQVLMRMAELVPSSAETWYDLAAVRAGRGRVQESVVALREAVRLNRERRTRDALAPDLAAKARSDRRFERLRREGLLEVVVGAP